MIRHKHYNIVKRKSLNCYNIYFICACRLFVLKDMIDIKMIQFFFNDSTNVWQKNIVSSLYRNKTFQVDIESIYTQKEESTILRCTVYITWRKEKEKERKTIKFRKRYIITIKITGKMYSNLFVKTSWKELEKIWYIYTYKSQKFILLYMNTN